MVAVESGGGIEVDRSALAAHGVVAELPVTVSPILSIGLELGCRWELAAAVNLVPRAPAPPPIHSAA